MDAKTSASKTAAGWARHWLDQALRAAQVVQRGNSMEALHDLRTSLRRLRVVLSAYRDLLGRAASPRLRGRLRDISHLTSPARDGQVWAAWLRKHGAPCEMTRRLAQHLDAVSRYCREDFRSHGLPQFLTAAQQLSAHLDRVKPQAKPFAKQAKKAIARAAKRLEKAIEPVRKGGTPGQMHAARIRIKRLRYLLEPFAVSKGKAKALVEGFRQLQDELGELHDLHELTSCGIPPASEPARAEAKRLEKRLRRNWFANRREKRLTATAKRWH